MHMSSIVPPPKRKTVKSDKQFPGKLYCLISFSEREGHENVISWVRDGKAFAVHDPDRLVMELLPRFFGQTKYRSFRRQLNMWSFERVLNCPHKNMFSHPLFYKGGEDHCKSMSRHDYQVAGITSMQMTQDSIVREVYGNAPVLTDSSGNVINQNQQSPSLFNYQGLLSTRPSSMSGMLSESKQDVDMPDRSNTVLVSTQSSSLVLSSPPGPMELLAGISTEPQELPSARSFSLSGVVSTQDQSITTQSIRAPIPLTSLPSTSNAPTMTLQSVQLSLYPAQFDESDPKKVNSGSQYLLQQLQQELQEEFCDDSSEDKKMPAKDTRNDESSDDVKAEGNDDNILEGSAVPFEGRQFFFVDANEPSEDELILETAGLQIPVEIPPASATELKTQPTSGAATFQEGINSRSHLLDIERRTQVKKAEVEAQNRLLQQFANWKTHGPPDADMSEDEYDSIFD